MPRLLHRVEASAEPDINRFVLAEDGIRPIGQFPAHEALLLRHLEGCHQLGYQTAAFALTEFVRRWVDYPEPMPAQRLSTRLGIEELRRARAVEESLGEFLRECGFPIRRQ